MVGNVGVILRKERRRGEQQQANEGWELAAKHTYSKGGQRGRGKRESPIPWKAIRPPFGHFT
jgi:hypothetical protein